MEKNIFLEGMAIDFFFFFLFFYGNTTLHRQIIHVTELENNQDPNVLKSYRYMLTSSNFPLLIQGVLHRFMLSDQ